MSDTGTYQEVLAQHHSELMARATQSRPAREAHIVGRGGLSSGAASGFAPRPPPGRCSGALRTGSLLLITH